MGQGEAQGAQRKGQGEDEEGPSQGPRLRSTAHRRLRKGIPRKEGCKSLFFIYVYKGFVDRGET